MPRTVDLASAGLRPGILRAANKVFRCSRQIDADKLIAVAVKRAGHDDFGEDWTEEPLRRLVDSANGEASLSPIGRWIMTERLKGALVTRLRAVKVLNANPEILEQEVAPIWLISGLQRTGTTYLQRLLGGDPHNRSLHSWESLDPVPYGDRRETSRRVRKARLSERALKWISPGFFAIHPIDHLGPEEDVLLLDPTFLSTAPEALMHVPSFGKWLEKQDHTIAYTWEKKMLQLLQWQRPANRWILKSPHHLEHIEPFMKVFPDTRIIWTHRDPRETLPSFMSMVYHGRAIFSDTVSIDDLKQRWLEKSALMLERILAYREAHEKSIIDIPFELLVDEPVNAVKRIYEHDGANLTPKAISGIENVISNHRRHRFGVHEYEANAFGLNEQHIVEEFRDYYTLLKSIHAG